VYSIYKEKTAWRTALLASLALLPQRPAPAPLLPGHNNYILQKIDETNKKLLIIIK